jgi:mannose-6-phosphate isomerase-like protein (cupin superfamily)
VPRGWPTRWTRRSSGRRRRAGERRGAARREQAATPTAVPHSAHQSVSHPTFIDPDERARALLIGPADGARTIFRARERYPAGFFVGLRTHGGDESFEMREGHVRITVGAEQRVCGPGAVVFVPPGVRAVLQPWPERHVNSSCDPNAYVRTGADGVRRVLARRAIAAGEELTYDFLLNCHGGIVWQCACGGPHCRGTIPGSFFDLPLDEQRRLRQLLDEWFVTEHRDEVAALAAPVGQPSIL